MAIWSSSESDRTHSIAWGDYDGDGDLDLAVANGSRVPNRVYRNDGGSLTLAWSSTETDRSTSVAWGDWDGDGDLDLAVGNVHSFDSPGQPSRVYSNDAGNLTLAWSSSELEQTNDVAWADWDGDGDLDLAVGNGCSSPGCPSRVYRNDGAGLELAWSSAEVDATHGVAWGDWDSDGDLDLAVGSGAPGGGESNRVYANDRGNLTLAWSSPELDVSRSVAWGDWDGDGDLDLAVGNSSDEANRVYRNDGGALNLAWTSPETDSTWALAWADVDSDGDLDLTMANSAENRLYRNGSGGLALDGSSVEMDFSFHLAWGDFDADGDLDLAVGNAGLPNRVYRNDGGVLVLDWSSIETDTTESVAWGDFDADGDLDLACGNVAEPNRIYRNDGGALVLAWSSPESDRTYSLAWADWDGDGDLDLASGNFAEPNRVYRNDGGVLALAWSSLETDGTESVRWGDWDGDGDVDLAVGNEGNPNRVYRNTHVRAQRGLPESDTHPVTVARPGTTDSAFFYSTPEILSSPVMIPYLLVDAESDRGWLIVPEYSLQGGGAWLAATEGLGGDGTTNLSASAAGEAHIYSWDAASDGASGDNIVFRISVLWQAPDHCGFPIQLPRLSSITPPFRVGESCLVASLAGVSGLKGVKDGAQGATFLWDELTPAPAQYNLNSVEDKLDIHVDRSHRGGWPGGIADPQCDAVGTNTCTDLDALSAAQPDLLFYQVVAACGPSGDLEGPVF